jgi:hypothetical protein
MAPLFHDIQPSFAGGEFAPALAKRVDLQKRAVALKLARNFIVHPHGGVSNRRGTRYVARAKFSNRKARLISFEFSVTQAYAIEFGHLYCRFHLNGGTLLETAKTITGATAANPVVITSNAHGYSNGDSVVITGVVGMTQLNGKTFTVAGVTANTFQLSGVNGTAYTAYVSGGTVARIYEVVTPYTETDLPDLKVTQSADVLYVTHPDHAPQTLTRFSDTPPNWVLAAFPFTGGPFMVSNTTETDTMTASATTGSVTLTTNFDLFKATHVGALFRIRHAMPAQALSSTFAANGTSGTMKCGGTWRLITHGTWSGTLQIEQSLDDGATWALLREFTGANDKNFDTFGDDDGPFLLRLTMANYSAGTLTADLSSDPYDHTGIAKITAVATLRSATATVQKTIGNTTATWEWAEGSWSDERGYPRTVVFFEDRLCFAATDAEPDTTWMSETGVYTSFGTSTPLVDSDAIGVPLPSRKMNGIQNLVGLQRMLALTSATDWSVGPSPGQAIVTPTAIQTKVEGYRGSASLEPVIVGNRVVYVQPMGTVVRDLGYDYQVEGYTGDNLSILSSHLFAGYTIIEMAYQQEPDSLIWCVRSDGVLLSLTYMREEQINAWTWHDTNGSFESVCSIPSNGYNEVWVMVLRNGARFVERLSSPLQSTDPKQQFFVDCGLSYDSPVAITGITKASPAVVTATAHGFSNGDYIDLSDVLGMTEVNGVRYKAAGVTANTFQLTDEETGAAVNSTSFGTYTSSGKARKAVTSVSGLDHLEGQKVSILADGNVHPSQVVTAGAITLTPRAAIVQVGLAYLPQLETLSLEVKLQDGTTQDRKYRIPRVTVSFLNSRGGFIGADETSLQEITQRTSEPLGSPIGLITDDTLLSLDGDYTIGASVFFEQRDPLPVTILAIQPQMEIAT